RSRRWRKTKRARAASMTLLNVSRELLFLACGHRPGRGRGLVPVLRLDALELLLATLPDRALEPAVRRHEPPAAKQEQRGSHRDRGVVQEDPLEARVLWDASVRERDEEHD